MHSFPKQTMDFWTTVVDFAQTLTTRVGKQLLIDFGHAQATEKTDGSLVTQSDQWADQEIRAAIAHTFPDHGVLTEEAEHQFPGTDWCWVIDPLDGTTNFARGIPIWAVSLGLHYRGTPIFGYVYVPPLEQAFHGFWYGESGLDGPIGAFLNQQPISSSADELTKNHFFSLCARSVSVMQNPFPCKIRMLGSAAYNLLTVAMGATLGGVEATPKVWDLAGVWPIIQAAGASWVSLHPEPLFPLKPEADYSEQPFPTLVVARSELVAIFQPLVQPLITIPRQKCD